jgi:hypothetical protein
LVLDQIRLVTWAKTLMSARVAPLPVWKKWIWRSLLPPPVARRLGCHGAKAMALTAAECWNVWVWRPGPWVRRLGLGMGDEARCWVRLG